MTTVERLFASTYLELVSLAQDESAGAFYSTSDYGKLESLGPSLPSLKVALPRTKGFSSSTDVQLDFKLIKPPFKFNISLAVSGTSTISRVKQNLISAVELLTSAGVTPAGIKLLVKGKVILDTALVASLGEGNVLIMAMVSAPKQSEVSTEAESAAVAETVLSSAPTAPSASSDTGIPTATWSKIEQVLKEDLGADRGAVELRRLQGI